MVHFQEKHHESKIEYWPWNAAALPATSPAQISAFKSTFAALDPEEQQL